MSSPITLKMVFDDVFSKVKWDGKLAKRLLQWQTAFVNRNSEHMEFFGSNLLGVHVIRFKQSDVVRFFDEVFNLEYEEVVAKVRTVTTINHTFKVTGDVLNLSLMYTIHRCLTSPEMTNQQQYRSAYDAALIFFYRCICALCSDYFLYPVDPKVAQATYAKLTNKFLIKRLGNWHKVMDYRTQDLVNKSGLHYDKLVSFKDDDDIVGTIADAQGRIRDMVKNYYGEFVDVHSQGGTISVTKGTGVDIEGEEVIMDKTRGKEVLVMRMRTLLTDKDGFVKDELVQVIAQMNTNSSFRMIKHTVSWLCDSYPDKSLAKDIDEFLSMVVIQSQWMIHQSIPPARHKDLPYVLETVKNNFLSTRTTDPDILKIRKLGEKLVKKANGSISNSLALATRTSIILYVILRSLTISSYS